MEEKHDQFSFFAFLLTFLLAIFMVRRMLKKFKTSISTPKLPPGPWKLPITGNMHQLRGSLPHRRLRELAKEYGPIMRLQLGEITNIVISSPEVAREVLKTHDVVFAHRPSILAAKIILYNCTDIARAPFGDYWRQLRRICTTELLSAKRVQLFRPIREDEVSSLMRSISSSAGSPVNLSKLVFTLSLNFTSRAAFGELDSKHKDEFMPVIRRIIEMMGGLSIVDLFPSIKFLQLITGRVPEIKRLHQAADTVLESIIERKLAESKKGSESEVLNLLDLLWKFQDHGDIPLSRDNIKAVILDMFLAGAATSATVIEWAVSEMLKDPRVWRKAQAEVRQVFHGKENIGEEKLEGLQYLDLVLKETLRLHPPGPFLIPRESKERVEINGYEIPAKSRVIVNAWALGRDPNCWINAERFYPERFIDSLIDFKGKDYQYIPFGAGRRICPGILYGMTLVKHVLASLLYHFDWQLPNGMKPKDLDMSETFGGEVTRKNELYLIPAPYYPLTDYPIKLS